jgi:hypothetical protein
MRLRKTFGPKRGEVTEQRETFHSEESHHLRPSRNIIRVLISRRIGWAGHVERKEENRNTYKHSIVWKTRLTAFV